MQRKLTEAEATEIAGLAVRALERKFPDFQAWSQWDSVTVKKFLARELVQPRLSKKTPMDTFLESF
jgi:hypothetical protein